MLQGTDFSEVPSDLTIAVVTMFAMPGTVAGELSNKATRKQQDRAQEHCKVAGERIPQCVFAMVPNVVFWIVFVYYITIRGFAVSSQCVNT